MYALRICVHIQHPSTIYECSIVHGSREIHMVGSLNSMHSMFIKSCIKAAAVAASASFNSRIRHRCLAGNEMFGTRNFCVGALVCDVICDTIADLWSASCRLPGAVGS